MAANTSLHRVTAGSAPHFRATPPRHHRRGGLAMISPSRRRRRPNDDNDGISRRKNPPRALPDDADDAFDLSTLTKRMEALKRQEETGSTATIQVVVLDATLPGQRLTLRFRPEDAKRRMNAGTHLGPLAEVGDTYAMLGQAPSSGQVLPLGTEVEITRLEPHPDGGGDTEVELVGLRRLRIEGQPFNENGVAMAKVTFMTWAPEDTPPLPPEQAAEAETSAIRGDHPAAGTPSPSSSSSSSSSSLSSSSSASSSSSSGDAEDAAVGGGGGGGGKGGIGRQGGGEDAGVRLGDTREGAVNAGKTRTKAEACEQMSVKLEELVDEWSGLVRRGGFERQPDQLQLIRSHIGPIPPAEEAARRASWVAALINPIPALGVAYEIRPALLMVGRREPSHFPHKQLKLGM